MPMAPISPFENEELSAFRNLLHETGRRIDREVGAYGIEGEDASRLKQVALAIVKTGVMRRAKGETVLDKVTEGMKASLLASLFNRDNAVEKVNFRNRAIILGYFDGFDSFDPRRLAEGMPQEDAFLIEAARELDALDFVARSIDVPYAHLAQTEDHFFEKVSLFREFENREIGHFYDWQKVEDPFSEKAPEAPAEPGQQKAVDIEPSGF